MALSLASCHKDEIWDLRAEWGLIWDHFRALVPIGTKSKIWDLIASTVLVIWILSFQRPNFPKPKPTLFSETETETFFRDQIFSKPKPRLFFRNQIFQNRNPQRFGKSFETEMSISVVHAGEQHESSWGTISLFKYKISLCSSIPPSSSALQMIGGWNPDSNLSSLATWQALPPAPYNDHRLVIIPALPSSLHIAFSSPVDLWVKSIAVRNQH